MSEESSMIKSRSDELERLRFQVAKLQADNVELRSRVEQEQAEKNELLQEVDNLRAEKNALQDEHEREMETLREAFRTLALERNEAFVNHMLMLRERGIVSEDDLETLSARHGGPLDDIDLQGMMERAVERVFNLPGFPGTGFRPGFSGSDFRQRRNWWRKLLFAIICGAANFVLDGPIGAFVRAIIAIGDAVGRFFKTILDYARSFVRSISRLCTCA